MLKQIELRSAAMTTNDSWDIYDAFAEQLGMLLVSDFPQAGAEICLSFRGSHAVRPEHCPDLRDSTAGHA